MQSIRMLVSLLVATFLFATACVLHGQESGDPFSTGAAKGKATWGGGADEGWQGTAATIDERDPITTGGIGCPVIVAGPRVFSSDTFALVSTLEADYGPNTLTALSGDGSYFAAANKSHNQDDTSVSVFDVASGKKVSEIPGFVDEILDILLITRNKYVVTAGRMKPVVRVWNAETGKLVKEFPIAAGARLDQGNVAFTADGHFMAVVADKQLQVIKVSSSKVVAVMQPPTLAKEGRNGRRTPFSSTDHIFIYAWIQDMKFSPDGKQLAAVSTHRGNRVLCWNQKAKLEVNQPFSPVQHRAFWENDLQWLPDGNAWLVGGNLVDRASGNVLLAFDEKFGSSVELLVHDQNTLVGRLASRPTQLSKRQIPWEAIERSRKAMAEKTPAFIAPYQPVDIQLDLGGARGAAGETEKQITAAIMRRLQRDQITYKAGSPSYFRLSFSESEGETLPIYERQSPFDFRGRDTGETATEAKGSLVVEFHVEGRPEPLWREAFDARSSRSFHEEINQQTIRESMLRSLAGQLDRMHFPYFMPVDENLAALPIILN